jgi:hypothetical protein
VLAEGGNVYATKLHKNTRTVDKIESFLNQIPKASELMVVDEFDIC